DRLERLELRPGHLERVAKALAFGARVWRRGCGHGSHAPFRWVVLLIQVDQRADERLELARDPDVYADLVTGLRRVEHDRVQLTGEQSGRLEGAGLLHGAALRARDNARRKFCPFSALDSAQLAGRTREILVYSPESTRRKV